MFPYFPVGYEGFVKKHIAHKNSCSWWGFKSCALWSFLWSGVDSQHRSPCCRSTVSLACATFLLVKLKFYFLCLQQNDNQRDESSNKISNVYWVYKLEYLLYFSWHQLNFHSIKKDYENITYMQSMWFWAIHAIFIWASAPSAKPIISQAFSTLPWSNSCCMLHLLLCFFRFMTDMATHH